MFASLAQAYLLSQRPDIRMADLTYSPSAIAEEKLSAGLEVAGAIRNAVRSEDWEAYDRIAGDVAYMIPRMDMKQELASAMYLDHGREQPYFQDEFRRLMASPANSPRVGALLASAGRLAQDIGALCTVRLTHRSETQREFQRSCRTLEAIGEREGQWLNEELSRPARQAAEDPERDARSTANRQAAENVRRLIAVDGVLHRNAELINDLQIPEEEDRLRPSGAYLRSYGGKKQKEYVLMPDGSRQRGPDGEPLIREKAEDMRALVEPAAGPNGEELKPQFATAQPAWAFSRLYSAWKNMMDTTEYVRKVPDWETVAAGMQSNTDLANQIAGRNPQFLALDPTFAAASTYPESIRTYAPDLEAVAERSAAVEEYARRAEFMPADPAVRDDYRVLTDVFRNLVREMDELMRMDAWLEQIDKNRGVQYLRTRDRNRLTPEQRAFVDEYNRQRFGNGEPDGIGSLERDMIEAASGQLEEALKMTEGLLRYAWGETDETLEQVLRGFNFDSRGGAEERPGYTLYYELIRAGIDPDSIRPLVERLRAENIGRRMEERRFDEAVMQLSAWRETDAAEIERFAQRIAQEIGTAEPSGAEAALRLRELANGVTADGPAANVSGGSADAPAADANGATADAPAANVSGGSADAPVANVSGVPAGAPSANANGVTAGVLSANARATLAANFDRTFGKYFSPQQMSDGTAYRHIRVGGTNMMELVQSYDDARSASLQEAEEKAKVELMTRILAGDRIEVEQVLPDGKMVLRQDGEPSRALLRVEPSQRSLERTLEIVGATVGARETARADEAARQEESRLQEQNREMARAREEQVENQRQEFRHLPPVERKARLNRDFADAYGEIMARRRLAPPDQMIGHVRVEGAERARKELEADGIFDVLAHSALGAREVADIQRAFRGLETYRASVPAGRAEAFGRCIDLLQRNWQELDQIRYEQEVMRIYPGMGEYLERNARVPVSEGQRPGQAADERMNEEAENLYRASMMLVQMLRYGAGESTDEEWQNYFIGNSVEELEELLEEGGLQLEDFVNMADELRNHIPGPGIGSPRRPRSLWIWEPWTMLSQPN